jgi:hypothetical protein
MDATGALTEVSSGVEASCDTNIKSVPTLEDALLGAKTTVDVADPIVKTLITGSGKDTGTPSATMLCNEPERETCTFNATPVAHLLGGLGMVNDPPAVTDDNVTTTASITSLYSHALEQAIGFCHAKRADLVLDSVTVRDGLPIN